MKNSNISWYNEARDELRRYFSDAGLDADLEFAKLVSTYQVLLLHGQHACAHESTNKAIRSFKQCLLLKPDSYVANCALGRIYLVQGNYKKSEKYIRKAIELSKDDFKNNLTWLYLLSRTCSDNATADRLQGWLDDRMAWFINRLSPGMSLNPAYLDIRSPHAVWMGSYNSEAGTIFRKQKFVLLKNMLPPEFVELIHRQQLANLNNSVMQHQPEMKRYAVNDLPVSVMANYQLAGLISRVTGRAVIPTYTCAIHYLSGGFIAPHVDRKQNELSITFSLAITPAGGRSAVYAGESEHEMSSFDLETNEGLLYRGAEVTHARDTVPDGYTVDQTIFGFRTVNQEHCYCI